VLLARFWPELPPDAGRNNLSVMLNSLRKALSSDDAPAGSVIVADNFNVQLNPRTVTTDVAEFEEAIRRGRDFSRSPAEQVQHLIAAVELYRGELLLGYYENWIIPEQRRLEELFFQAVRELIDCLKAAGDIPRAINYAHRTMSLDPLREELHRELMQLYVTTGQPSAALRQYRELERMLGEKLNAAPALATQQLYHRISDQWSVSSEQLPVSSNQSAKRTTQPPHHPTTSPPNHRSIARLSDSLLRA
jgi:DNA-binding SARP family transcriptional activator